MQPIQNRLSQIAETFLSNLDSQDRYQHPGLFEGDAGILLFLAYYANYNKEKQYTDLLDRHLELCLEQNSRIIPEYSFCNGICGILYNLFHLQQKGFIDVETDEARQYYREYIARKMSADISNGQYDFMHYALGAAIYFLKTEPGESQNHLDDFIRILYKKREKNNGQVKWLSNMNITGRYEYNIGMAHGMSSIVIFLCQAISTGINREICEELLDQTVRYILAQEIDHLQYGSYFPTTSIESQYPDLQKSRLGWCYGDLGVATALWRAGKTMEKEYWKKKALEIFEFNTTRTALESNNVMDAVICHGTAGIAQIFRRMHLETGNQKFLDTSTYWIQETLKMAKWEDGVAGYKCWLGKDYGGWGKSYSFLEGIAGIGLALLAAIGEESFSDWDEIILLS